MVKPSTFLGLCAGLLLSASACAEQWFTVASPGIDPAATLVEIDLDTLRMQGGGGEGAIRVTLDVLQPHHGGFEFRSFVATAQFDCSRRSIALTSAAYYPLPAGKGPRLGVDSSGRQAGMPPTLLESMPTGARHALLKAMCATAPVN
jgi:hypothetical protein